MKRVWLYARSAIHDDNAIMKQLVQLKDFSEQEQHLIVGVSVDKGSGTSYHRKGLN